MPRKDGTPTKREDQLQAFRTDLTRRKAWWYIACLAVGMLVFAGAMVVLVVQEGTLALAVMLPNFLLGVPLAVGAAWWLLKETRPSSELPSEFGGTAGPLLPARSNRPGPARQPSDMCRLCGLRLRPTEELVRLEGELFHVVCAEPAMSHTPAWRARELGTLNQLTEGIGRSTHL